MTTWRIPFVKQSKPKVRAELRPAIVIDERALDAAKAQLAQLQADDFLIERQLSFAHSLLRAVGENPKTLPNQVLAHQMAIEHIRGYRVLTAPR
jgi:hypothetical protein